MTTMQPLSSGNVKFDRTPGTALPLTDGVSISQSKVLATRASGTQTLKNQPSGHAILCE